MLTWLLTTVRLRRICRIRAVLPNNMDESCRHIFYYTRIVSSALHSIMTIRNAACNTVKYYEFKYRATKRVMECQK